MSHRYILVFQYFLASADMIRGISLTLLFQIYIQNTEKSFTYDYAFDGPCTNEELYVKAVQTVVRKLFTGFNVTVLAYGQTGSGKTHSMGTAYR